MASKALEQAYTKVINLEPLSPNASPSKKMPFFAEATKYFNLIGMMHCHVQGVLTASGIDEEPPYSWDEPEVSAKKDLTPEARVAWILQFQGEKPFEVDTWIDFVANSRKKTLYDAEQHGFVRLLLGYRAAETWEATYDALVDARNGDPCETSVFARGIALEDNEDAVARLHERERIILAVDSANTIQRFFHCVMGSIQAIRFAFDWATLSRETKAAFQKDVFQKINPDFATFTESGYNKQFKAFKSRHERVIKARNDLKKLFLRFHAGVLMDECWTPTVSHLSAKTGRTPTFPGTLTLFLNKAERTNIDVVNETADAFLKLMTTLMPSDFAEYLSVFLAKYHPGAEKGEAEEEEGDEE